jgi:heterodisulfide reductase subunit C
VSKASKTVENSREFKTDEDFDSEFFQNIERKSNIWSCIQCGSCTASCESGRWTALKTRLIIRKVVLGDLSVLKDPDIWLCTTCYQCYERCPRDVRPTDVIMELRNYATKLGNISPKHRAVVGYLKNFGHAVPINDQIREQRKELGLEELPPTLFKYRDEEDGDLKKIEKKLFDLPPEKEEKEEKGDN